MVTKMLKLTMRQIRSSLTRFLAIAAIVALGVGFFCGLRLTKTAMVHTLDEYTENYLPLSSLPPVLFSAFPVRALATADRFNDSAADYALLTKELNADIRDMEGCAIVQTAKSAGVPVYSFKAISDVAVTGHR